MYMIAGLGNPGRKYEHTRHNSGFDVVDELADKMGITAFGNERRALVAKGYYEGNKVLLVKPQTFMNNSGESVRPIADYYGIDVETQLIVIYDDVALDPGIVRVRKSGSAGGHNGMKNIIQHLGTQEFCRVRVGVGKKPQQMDLVDHVLGHFSPEDRKLMDEGFDKAVEATLMILDQGPDAAMNHVNRKVTIHS